MSKRRPNIPAFVIGGLALILVALVTSLIAMNTHATTKIQLGLATFDMRLAATGAARQQGLSGVDQLAHTDGLLMVFRGDNYWGIWMKDMKIPLDIIWLNNEKKVIYIVNDASPSLGTSRTFIPADPARYVLEVSAGTVSRAAIKIGDIATFNVMAAQS